MWQASVASRKSGHSARKRYGEGVSAPSPRLSRKENTMDNMDSITYDFSDNPYMLAVIRAFITKRRHEKELADSREVWADAMIEARNAGVTIADMSRATGVASPSIINVINTALAKRPVVATEATEG